MESNQYSNLTIEKLEQIIKYVMLDISKGDNEIVIGQGCLTKGFVTRSWLNLNICNNPDCTSCREWDNAMKEELKSLGLKPYIPAPLENDNKI